MKPDAADILILLGLIILGVGLFFWFGRGVALSVDGALLFFYGAMAKMSARPKIPTGKLSGVS